jgi:hypothetical protein
MILFVHPTAALRGAAIVLAVAIVASLVCASATAAPILIDDFQAPAGQTSYVIRLLNPANTLVIETPGAGILGGERDLLIHVVSPVPAEPISAAGTVGDGRFDFVSGATARVRAVLQYDGLDADGGSLVNSAGLNLDLTAGGNNALRLWFDSVDGGPSQAGLGLQIVVTGPGGPATFNGTIPASASPSVFTAGFAAFDTTAPFPAATSLTFTFNPSAPSPGVAADFTLRAMAAVPEPSTIVLSLAGLLACAPFFRRRLIGRRGRP